MKDGKPVLWHRAKDLTGRKFAYLEILGYAGSKKGKTYWNAKCVCGSAIEVEGAGLTRARGPSPKSCGCRTGEFMHSTHRMTKHPAYHVWTSMRDRCRLPSHQAWHNYGGRGIKVCKRWERFESFWEDMKATYREGLTLERMNNDKGYSKKNCQWVTYERQNNNRRDNVWLDTSKGRMTMAQAARAWGIRQDTLRYRLKHGWTIEDSLNTKPLTFATRGRAKGSP